MNIVNLVIICTVKLQQFSRFGFAGSVADTNGMYELTYSPTQKGLHSMCGKMS